LNVATQPSRNSLSLALDVPFHLDQFEVIDRRRIVGQRALEAGAAGDQRLSDCAIRLCDSLRIFCTADRIDFEMGPKKGKA
jgi:hypothetical protein